MCVGEGSISKWRNVADAIAQDWREQTNPVQSLQDAEMADRILGELGLDRNLQPIAKRKAD
jgi:hypothetical protein